MHCVRWAVVISLLSSCAAPDGNDQQISAVQPATTASDSNVLHAHSFDFYQSAEASRNIFVVDSDQSYADIVVRRGGRLKQFGHDHVVTFRNLEGFLWKASSGRGVQADLRIGLKPAEIDQQAARETYRLDTDPSAADIESTARNLHVEVLDTERYPTAWLHVSSVERNTHQPTARVHLTLKEVERSFSLPVQLSDADHRQTVSGHFVILQSDFGIEPFSVLGGNLKVLDELEVYFHVEFVALAELQATRFTHSLNPGPVIARSNGYFPRTQESLKQ